VYLTFADGAATVQVLHVKRSSTLEG
jgi:hypothetical protein